MTLTPPFSRDAAARSRAQRLLAEKSPRTRKAARCNVAAATNKKSPCESDAARRNVARLLNGKSPDAPGESCASTSRRSCRMLPFPHTRAVICNAASCAGVRVAEPPAHESPPSPRVCRVRRPGSSNITASCVREGVCAVTLAADPACAPGRAARAPACRHPSRPPLVWRIVEKSARESNLAQWNVATATDKKSVSESEVVGEKIAWRMQPGIGSCRNPDGAVARMKTESRRMVAGSSLIGCRVRCSWVGGRLQRLCFEGGVLACRSGARTFAAAWCSRMSLACSLGTLAAVPGCMKMLAHFLFSRRAVA
jgi:hypothetical protein